MRRYVSNVIYRQVHRSFVLLKKSTQALNNFFEEKDFWERKKVYYLARGCYRAGNEYYQEALRRARRLAGPVEEYVIFPERLVKWRKDLLEKDGVLVKSVAFEDIRAELVEDEALRKWMNQEEIEFFLKELYERQMKGKRKLYNIKLRIVLERIGRLLSKAQELKEDAERYIP